MATPFRGPTVVITHHAPHPNSVNSRFVGDPLNPAFVSDLGDLIARHQPDLWLHGHTHCSGDYRLGRTRVICNPAGYGRENPAFDPTLVVEVPDGH
jgi:Icc-related predicted phosphoesterase